MCKLCNLLRNYGDFGRRVVPCDAVPDPIVCIIEKAPPHGAAVVVWQTHERFGKSPIRAVPTSTATRTMSRAVLVEVIAPPVLH